MSSASIRERIDHALAIADSIDAANVFTLRLDKQARAAADAADADQGTRTTRPLRGLPVVVKDNIDQKGITTTAGSIVLRDRPPALADAPVLSRLLGSGAILLGRTNMTEFAFSGLGLNPHYGTPNNPAFCEERRIPGGSTSGGAVAVALGIAAVAIGTDTGGSIRIPAAFCGVTGFKATARAVDRCGVLPLSTSLDSIGILARNVADCSAAFQVMRGTRRSARVPCLPKDLSIGLVTNYVTADLSSEVASAFQEATRIVRAADIAIESVNIPELDTIASMTAEATFPGVEAFAWHRSLLQAGYGSHYDPRVLVRIEAGGRMTPSAYARLVRRRSALISSVNRRISRFNVIAFPTAPLIAPTFDSLAADDDYHRCNALVLRNSTVINLIDGCAISLPCPNSPVPVGFTIAAPANCDDALLSAAAVIEAIFREAGNGDHQGA